MSLNAQRLLLACTLIASLALAGCAGDNESTGDPAGDTGGDDIDGGALDNGTLGGDDNSTNTTSDGNMTSDGNTTTSG